MTELHWTNMPAPRHDTAVPVQQLLSTDQPGRRSGRAGRHRHVGPSSGWWCLAARILDDWGAALRAVTVLAVPTAGLAFAVNGPGAGVPLAATAGVAGLGWLSRRRANTG